MENNNSIYSKEKKFQPLLTLASRLPCVTTAVVHPVTPSSLCGAIDAAQLNLIEPILVGPEDKILACADKAHVNIAPYELLDTEHSHAAAELAVKLIKNKQAQILMKGSLHTDEFLHPVLARHSGLRTDKRLSQVFVLDVPTYHKLLFITDCAINIAPDLLGKRDIIQNAINLAINIGIASPKVAILSAVETIVPRIPATLDAAALCKMAERGQITNGILEGPLAFDNAISMATAREKGINSIVPGHADILLAPDLEAANMLAKQLMYLGNAQAAGIVLGARVPIVLTSRADNAHARAVSCALAVIQSSRQPA